MFTSYDIDARKPGSKPLNYSFGNREGLVKVLDALGFEIPHTLTALAAANKPLGTTSYEFPSGCSRARSRADQSRDQG